MRLVYITGGMPYGPGEVFIIEEIRELLRRGHEVLVVPRSPGRTVVHARDLVEHTKRESLFSGRVLRAAWETLTANPKSSVDCCSQLLCQGRLRLRVKNAVVLPKALWLADLVRRWRASHIHCHWAGTTATMAMTASERVSVPWSLSAHRSDITGNNLLSKKVSSAAFTRVISEDGVKMMRGLGVDTSNRVRVLHMGVRVPAEPGQCRADPPVVLCPADLLEIKGHRYLLEAWSLVKRHGIAGSLWLAGGGPLRTQLETQAQKLKIRDTVRFLGAMPNAELLQVYRTGQVSLAVLASIDMGNGEHEGIPVALMEAMSFGTPVVATRTGGIPELVRPGTGLLVSDKDPAALAQAISEILLDEELSRTLGRVARQQILRSFNVAQVVDELEGWFAAASRMAAVPC